MNLNLNLDSVTKINYRNNIYNIPAGMTVNEFLAHLNADELSNANLSVLGDTLMISPKEVGTKGYYNLNPFPFKSEDYEDIDNNAEAESLEEQLQKLSGSALVAPDKIVFDAVSKQLVKTYSNVPSELVAYIAENYTDVDVAVGIPTAIIEEARDSQKYASIMKILNISLEDAKELVYALKRI